MEQRLTEMEIRYTEQQALLQELSDVIYRQQREIDSLKIQVSRLEKRLAAAEDLPTIGAAEKPPHY